MDVPMASNKYLTKNVNMNHNEEDPDFLGGLGDMLPADVLKKVNELLSNCTGQTRITKAAPCSSMPQAASTWINSLILGRPSPALNSLSGLGTPYQSRWFAIFHVRSCRVSVPTFKP